MPLRVDGVAESLAFHRELARRARDLRPVLEHEAEEVEAMIERSWATRRSPSGRAWAPTRSAPRSPGRGLEDAHQVDAGAHSLTIRVPVAHASFQFFGTRRLPARNPLPVEPVGGGYRLASGGAVDAWIRGMLARVKRYLTAPEMGGRDGR